MDPPKQSQDPPCGSVRTGQVIGGPSRTGHEGEHSELSKNAVEAASLGAEDSPRIYSPGGKKREEEAEGGGKRWWEQPRPHHSPTK